MRKLLSLAACGLVALSGMAAPLTAAQMEKLTFHATPEQKQMMRAKAAKLMHDFENGISPEGAYTRSYTAKDGTVWKFQVTLDKNDGPWMYFGEYKGEEFIHVDFEKLPLYFADAVLIGTNPKTQKNTGAELLLCWPTYYWSDFLEKRNNADESPNYEPVDFEEFVNTTDHCRKFVEDNKTPVPSVNDDKTAFIAYKMLSSIFKIPAVYNGGEAMTEVTASKASSFTFNNYNADSRELDLSATLCFKETATNISRTVACNYIGTGKVAGWKNSVRAATVSNVHVFNTGTISSDILADVNPFPEDFPEVRCLSFVASDPVIKVQTNTVPGPYDNDTWGFAPKWDEVPAGESSEDHTTYVLGSMFAPVDFAGPDAGCTFAMLNPEEKYDEAMKQYYLSVYPQDYSLIPGRYTYDWSQEYGVNQCVGGYNEPMLDGQAYISFGTPDGLVIESKISGGDVIRLTATDKVIYHYDENDMTKTREIAAVGTYQPTHNALTPGQSGVAGVVADKAGVSVANGAINVNAVANVNVAVYKLDGSVVARKALKAGEEFNFAPGRGLYIVKAGNVTKKVVF